MPIPVLLHHGLFGVELKLGPLTFGSFPGIDRAIAARGYPVMVSRVHPAASIATRARQLKEFILRETDGFPQGRQRIIVIAHSMGGLDARYMITHLGMAGRVAALLTVSTPHRGSPYADWCLKHLGQRLRGMQTARLLKLDIQALPDLTTDSCCSFNEKTPDHPDVKYFSVSAHASTPPALFMHSHRIIADVQGPNDGMVSVTSATYARHLQSWPCDHLHVINKHLRLTGSAGRRDIAPSYLAALNEVLKAI